MNGQLGRGNEDFDQNAALDFAMKSNKKAKISHIELIPSCKNLPRTDPFTPVNPIAVLYICKNSMIKAQKMVNTVLLL